MKIDERLAVWEDFSQLYRLQQLSRAIDLAIAVHGLALARLMEAASVKEAIRATPRNAKSPGIILLVSSLSGVGCQLNARRRDRCPRVSIRVYSRAGNNALLLSSFFSSFVQPRFRLLR